MYTTVDNNPSEKMNSDIQHAMKSPMSNNTALNQQTPMGTKAINSFKIFDFNDAFSTSNLGSQQ